MSKFIGFPSLLGKSNLRPFEILEYMSKGLRAYTKIGLEWPCPKEFNQSYIELKKEQDLLNEIRRVTSGVVEYFSVTKQQLKKIIAEKSKREDQDKERDESYKEYNSQYEKIWYALFELKEIAQTTKKSRAYSLFKDSIEFEDRYAPPRPKLKPSSSKAIAETHLGHINEMKRIHYEIVKLQMDVRYEIDSTNWNSWDNFKLPLDEELRSKLEEKIKDKLFVTKNVEKILPMPEIEEITNDPLVLSEDLFTDKIPLQDQADEKLREICPKLEIFYNDLKEEVDNVANL